MAKPRRAIQSFKKRLCTKFAGIPNGTVFSVSQDPLPLAARCIVRGPQRHRRPA